MVLYATLSVPIGIRGGHQLRSDSLNVRRVCAQLQLYSHVVFVMLEVILETTIVVILLQIISFPLRLA